jgi:hypothetical protein
MHFQNTAPIQNASTVTLSIEEGQGSLLGTTSGIIESGQSSITIEGVIYSLDDSGVRLRATASGGTISGLIGTRAIHSR